MLSSARRVALLFCLLALAPVASGCGGERQDVNEQTGSFKVAVTRFEFPKKQELGRGIKLKITVANKDSETINNIAVTIKGFDRVDPQPGLEDPNRPIWIIDKPPYNGATELARTWALGRLEPGAERTFTWELLPTVAGHHNLSYEISPGIFGGNGKKSATAVLESGDPARGVFDTVIQQEARLHVTR